MTEEKQEKQPRWWIKAIFVAFVGWVFTLLTPIGTALATGVVNLGETGWGPILTVVGVTLLVAVVTFVIAIRLALTYALSVSVGLWDLITVLTAKVYGGSVRFVGIAPGSLPINVYRMGTYPPPNNRLRGRVRYAVGRFLLWLCVPKEYLDYFKANSGGQPWEPVS